MLAHTDRSRSLRRLMLNMYGVFCLSMAVVSAVVVGFTMVLPFVVLPRGRRERYTMVGAQVWARFMVQWVLFARVRVTGSLPAEGGAILLCNHRSWLDPLLLIGWARSNGLSKKAILYIPAVGLFGWLAGAVFFDRHSREQRAAARADVMHLVKGGHRIQLFPEGTRSKTGKLREKVYLTLVRDAYQAGIDVVPCAVWNTERALPAVVFSAFPFQEVDLFLGEPMHPGDHANAEAFAEAAWNAVRSAVETLSARSGA